MSAHIVPTDERHSVTTLELFFDLVFVFAFTQVTAFMADDLGGRGALRGLVLFALLWFVWCSYTWLGNQARADEGVVRLAVIVAMVATFLAALAIPEAWGDEGGGISAPVVLAVALAVVRLLHLGVYAVAALGDAGLRRQLVRTAVPVGMAVTLLVTGAVLGGPTQTVLWGIALVVDYAGVYAAGTDWRLPAPGHFAERYGLIVIIALGESIIAVGVGVADLPLTAAAIAAAVLGLAVSVALWWSYFDVVAPVAEGVLRGREGIERVRLARDSYTYLHFPMVAGVIYLALGVKKVAEYVGDESHHSLADPLPATALWSLYAGAAAYLIAHLGFRLRNVGSLNRPRAVVVVVLLLAPLVVHALPALVALGVLAAVLVALIAFEVVRYAEARAAVRAQAARPH
ncbi:low temperature requirement protein A [Blastococcus sp. TF02-8]|uniref:low temperature requirement protein A n=1 Tax=Blastococcus sp. TF02-8 TaxID=2250574 RepID=UPI000DEA5378|nr:low temperature requirement protein A [Blastococcus sp. TF02-8]RBY95777.1 low temperature requirement protein A [Blastococcus sp. TF02-8]